MTERHDVSLGVEPSATQDPNTPLPRKPRKARTPKEDRGLPPDKDLTELATEYLRVQRRHWPKLVEVGLLPDLTDDVVAAMVEDFKHRHRTGQVDPEPLGRFLKFCPKLAGDYNRYSCENSSPKSIIDQMVSALDKARQEERFVPWQYVFADYSVSGLKGSRQGYSSYKALLRDKNHFIETTYINDFTRASRDEVEWWRLAHLSRRLQKRMIGAGDGFDLSAPNWDMMITVYGLLSRMHIKGLREKVNRGMRGAARRGGCLGMLPLGFTRIVRREEDGNVVRDQEGNPQYVPCIDPATCGSRKLTHELFVQKAWSAYRIARHFNALKVDGRESWTEGGIKKLLWSASAIGVFIWNRTRREYDHEQEQWLVVRNPRKDWVVYHNPKLAIVPMELWKAARKKLAAMRRNSPLTGRKCSRNENSATTLFSGTLSCSYCEHEITLMRSTEPYKVMGCINGPTGKHRCKLSCTKSTRIIEKCLLGFLQDRLLTEEVVDGLIARANAFLEEEARKPRVDTAPLKAEIGRREAAVKKLVVRIEKEDDEALNDAYDKRVKEHQRELNRLRAALHQAEKQNDFKLPPPLNKERILAYLADVPALFRQDIPMAAEAIRTLTGSITIRQEPVPMKKRGARWIATFEPDLVQVLRLVAKDDPALAVLSAAAGGPAPAVEVVIDKVPKYEALAPVFKQMHLNGASIQSIASAHHMCWSYAADILEFAETGKPPKWEPRKQNSKTGGHTTKYVEIAEEVVRLRDVEKMSFTRIAAKLGVGAGTVRRAYDHLRPEAVRAAAERGELPDRASIPIWADRCTRKSANCFVKVRSPRK